MRSLRFLIALATAFGMPASSAAQARARVAPRTAPARGAVAAVAPLGASSLARVALGVSGAALPAPLAAAARPELLALPRAASAQAGRAQAAMAVAREAAASRAAVPGARVAASAASAPSAATARGDSEAAGDSRGALSRVAGHGSADGAADPAEADELFDARRRRLQDDDMLSLKIAGFRVDERTGRLFAPETGAQMTPGETDTFVNETRAGAPVTNAEIDAFENGARMRRAHKTMLRLARGLSPAQADTLKEVNRDALPSELLRPKAAATPDESVRRERAMLLRRLTSLHRRSLERAVPFEEPDSVKPVGAEVEEKLGALVSAAVLRRLQANPEGRRLLGELHDESGRLRLPTFRVLRLDDRMQAAYSGQQLVMNFDDVRESLLARLPETERLQAAQATATEGGLLAYLSRDPRAADWVAEGREALFFHELVHFAQDIQRPFQRALTKADVPDLLPMEMEYEAFFRQNLYVHGLLMRAGASTRIDQLERYLHMIEDFDGWIAGMDALYFGPTLLNNYVSVEEAATLHEQALALGGRLEPIAGAGLEAAEDRARAREAAGRKLRDMRAASSVFEAERRAAAGQLDGYRRRAEALAQEGLERYFKLSVDAGTLPAAAASARLLARRSSSKERRLWEERAERASSEALRRLASAEGLDLARRLEWINAMSDYLDLRWTPQLYAAALRDYPAQARLLREQAARGEEGGRAAREAQAEAFERLGAQNRAVLRGDLEKNLASFFDGTESSPRDAEWLAGAALALGDPEILRIVEPLRESLSGRADAAVALELAEDRALIRLADGGSLTSEQRVNWINAMTRHANVRGRPWKRELFEALIRDYSAMALERREQARRQAGEDRNALLESAAEFERIAGSHRARLRAGAESNLALARGSSDPAEGARLAEAGLWQARTAGDAALAAELEELYRAAASR